ncbi:MAG TPA: protein-ADP-ribose hydrolase, partial [Lachnospiraceae bacterium]|nr:protein-ADP-ribose hydrolase [Lachnospiraceae bacterium]
MNQTERRKFLIKKLLLEEPNVRNIEIPTDPEQQKLLLRAMMNLRLPKEIDEKFLTIQDEYLKNEIAQKGITDIKELSPIAEGIYLWQGDITTLNCDAIVNAANSGMTGCYVPNHRCIDNCIHTFSGIQLRNFCAKLMEKQGYEEPTGTAKITPAFNLPCNYILHTVG